MRIHTTTTAVLAVAALTLTGCSSDSTDDKSARPTGAATTTDDKPAAKATEIVTPAATPSLSQAETQRLCSVAVSEAAPEWEDWNFDAGEWQDDPRTPQVCQGLADETFPPRGNRAFLDALLDGLEMADDPRARQ